VSAEVLRRAADKIAGEWGTDGPIGSAWHQERDFHLSVADWLRSEASHYARSYPNGHLNGELDTASRHALTVARAYLGESS
jgi:hypothetical protein